MDSFAENIPKFHVEILITYIFFFDKKRSSNNKHCDIFEREKKIHRTECWNSYIKSNQRFPIFLSSHNNAQLAESRYAYITNTASKGQTLTGHAKCLTENVFAGNFAM